MNKFYTEGNNLVIEDSIILEKIDINSFDDIIISRHYPTRKYHISMFFKTPVQYEAKKGFINKVICTIFKHNNNPYQIKRTYYNNDVEQLLSTIKSILPSANIPNLKDSIHWKTEDENTNFKRTKLVYSRNGLGLKQVMLKHKILMEK